MAGANLGRFYRDAVGEVLTEFPEADPAFDKQNFDRLVAVHQRALTAEQEAYDLRQRLGRAEMANLALGQAVGILEAQFLANGPVPSRALQLVRSAMNELRLAEVGATNPDPIDAGPTVTRLVEARGHLEVASPIAGPARQSVAVATELIEVALQEVAQLGLHLEQMRREQG